MYTLSGLSTAEPSHCVSAEETKQFLAAVLPARRAEPLRRLVDGQQIKHRYTLAPLAELARCPSIEARSAAYEREAVELVVRAAHLALDRAGMARSELSALLVTSSTGYMIPALSEYLISRLRLPSSVTAIPIAGLGCVGAVRAVGLATRVLSDSGEGGGVLVASVELPSLWLQLAEASVQDIVGSTVFGDGAAAVVVRRSDPRRGFAVRASGSALWPDSLHARRGVLTTTGLRHTVSSALPAVVSLNLRRSVDEFLSRQGMSRADLAFCAINPSDHHMLGVAAAALGLDEPSLRPAQRVWEDRGNTLSSGPLYLLQALEAEPLPDGAQGVLLAFGPGVSCDMLLLQWNAHGIRSGHPAREPEQDLQ